MGGFKKKKPPKGFFPLFFFLNPKKSGGSFGGPFRFVFFKKNFKLISPHWASYWSLDIFLGNLRFRKGLSKLDFKKRSSKKKNGPAIPTRRLKTKKVYYFSSRLKNKWVFPQHLFFSPPPPPPTSFLSFFGRFKFLHCPPPKEHRGKKGGGTQKEGGARKFFQKKGLKKKNFWEKKFMEGKHFFFFKGLVERGWGEFFWGWDWGGAFAGIKKKLLQLGKKNKNYFRGHYMSSKGGAGGRF